MTQLFQVGDVVRINEPTPADIAAFEANIITPVSEDIIGHLAVVQTVSNFRDDNGVKHLAVQFILQNENYRFDTSHARSLNYQTPYCTLPSQLSLVCGSPFRTSVVTEDNYGLSGKPLPIAGMDVLEDTRLNDTLMLRAGATVKLVRLLEGRIVVTFSHAPSGTMPTKVIPLEQIGTPQFTTF